MRSESIDHLYYEEFEEEVESFEEFDPDEFWAWPDDWVDEDEPDYELFEEFEEYPYFETSPAPGDIFHILLMVVFIIFLAAGAIINNSRNNSYVNQEATNLGGRPSTFTDAELTAVAAPYKEYTLTQGLHGQSYGHLAIDLASGRGAALLSPINGIVTQLYTDEYGNTTLVIENDVYLVTILHGDYTIALDDELRVGQVIGSEGNNGYTMDMFGNLCYGRIHCGNHTHLNIYDKRILANVNPLNLIP